MTERQRAEVVRLALGRCGVFTLRQFVRLAPHLPGAASYRSVDELAEAVARCRPSRTGRGRRGRDVVDPYGGSPSSTSTASR